MKLLTNENFATATATGIVVVDFFATRCGPCKMIAPYLEQMATQFAGKVDFYKVDVDEQPYLSASQGIRAMPTLKVFRNGNIEETIVGADLDGLMKTIDRLLASETMNTKNHDTAGSIETAEQAKKVTIPINN